MKLVIPRIGLCLDGHSQRDEFFRRNVRQVGHHTLEVADLFEYANVLTEYVDVQLHAVPPRSRRSSSRVPDFPASTKLISIPRTARTASSFREPNSVSCPRSKRTRDSLVRPERAATSLWCSLRAFRRAATASPSSMSVFISELYLTPPLYTKTYVIPISLILRLLPTLRIRRLTDSQRRWLSISATSAQLPVVQNASTTLRKSGMLDSARPTTSSRRNLCSSRSLLRHPACRRYSELA